MASPVRRNDLTVRDLGSELILYDRHSETYHVLNDTARRIWDLLDGSHNGTSICELYANLYPQVDRERLDRDLLQALEEFGRRGLLAGTALAPS